MITSEPQRENELARVGDRSSGLATTNKLIDEARSGRIFILTNTGADEDEGVLVMPAQLVTPDAVNFMATHAGGIICLGLPDERVKSLSIPSMPLREGEPNALPHAASIEAKHGVTTGISAGDRAHTIRVAINAESTADDLVSPGHVFPCITRPGGVLVRAAFAEAGVDIAMLAGLNPSAVICRILDEDGETASGERLRRFAEVHDLEIGTINDLIGYRRRTEKLVECLSISDFDSEIGGTWALHRYQDTLGGADILALVKGAVQPERMLVRVHTLSVTDDVLRRAGDRSDLVPEAMKAIADAGSGVLVLIQGDERHEAAASGGVLREYGLGAQVLADLGARRIELLTKRNLDSVVGLDGFGIEVLANRSL